MMHRALGFSPIFAPIKKWTRDPWVAGLSLINALLIGHQIRKRK